MSENKETKCTCNEPISAFAYQAGRAIENFLHLNNNNLHLENQLLEAKIMDFHSNHKNFTGTVEELMKLYKAHFNLIEVTNGKIDLADLNPNERAT